MTGSFIHGNAFIQILDASFYTARHTVLVFGRQHISMYVRHKLVAPPAGCMLSWATLSVCNMMGPHFQACLLASGGEQCAVGIVLNTVWAEPRRSGALFKHVE